MMKYFLVKKTIPGTGLNKNNIVIQEVDGSIVLKTGNNEFLDVSWINVNNEDYFKDQTDYNPDARTKTSRMPLEEDIVGLVDFLEFGKVEIVNSQVIVVNRKISHS